MDDHGAAGYPAWRNVGRRHAVRRERRTPRGRWQCSPSPASGLRASVRRGLGASGSTTEPGTLVLDVLYRGKKVATSGKRALTKAGALKLVARFTTKGKRTLGRMGSVRLTLRLTATDAAGNVTVKKKTVKLKR